MKKSQLNIAKYKVMVVFFGITLCLSKTSAQSLFTQKSSYSITTYVNQESAIQLVGVMGNGLSQPVGVSIKDPYLIAPDGTNNWSDSITIDGSKLNDVTPYNIQVKIKSIIVPGNYNRNLKLTSADYPAGVSVAFTGMVKDSIVYIPDANFKAALIADPLIDKNSDGNVQFSEALAYTGDVLVYQKNISSLTGIEAFANITYLNCWQNNLTTLDVSKNTKLKVLDCVGNKLTVLDITKNTVLFILRCYQNNLTTLDVSKNIVLNTLDCSENQLTALDVSKNIDLYYLDCSDNKLTSLNLLNNRKLRSISTNGNNLTNYIPPKNPSPKKPDGDAGKGQVSNRGSIALEYFDISNNPLSSIDVADFPNLIYLNVSNMPITSITLPTNVDNLDISGTLISTLDVSTLANLDSLNVSKTNISVLNLVDKSKLKYLKVDSTALTSINVGGTILDSLDLSTNDKLTNINCSSSKLKYLNVKNGNNSNVTSFSATNNLFTCILVDDKNAAYLSSWSKDVSVNFVNEASECGAAGVKNRSKEFAVYPNPASNFLHINSNFAADVRILDLTGKIYYQRSIEGKALLNMESIPSGLYILEVAQLGLKQKLLISRN